MDIYGQCGYKRASIWTRINQLPYIIKAVLRNHSVIYNCKITSFRMEKGYVGQCDIGKENG